MGYSQDHIDKTRAKILAAAGTLMRKSGTQNASVAKVMTAAGLTHGGFYAHFDSKDALFAAVVAEQFEFEKQLEQLQANNVANDEALAQALQAYLNPKRTEVIGPACTMASCAVDVARAGKGARAGFTRAFKSFVKTWSRLLPGDRDPKPEALAGIATCVGALILARAIDDNKLQRELLDAALNSCSQ